MKRKLIGGVLAALLIALFAPASPASASVSTLAGTYASGSDGYTTFHPCNGALYYGANGHATGQCVDVQNSSGVSLTYYAPGTAGKSAGVSDTMTSLSVASFTTTTLAPGDTFRIQTTWNKSASGYETGALVAVGYTSGGVAHDDTFTIGGVSIPLSSGGEPSLQWILNADGTGVNDSDSDPSTTELNASSWLPPGAFAFDTLTPSNGDHTPITMTSVAGMATITTGQSGISYRLCKVDHCGGAWDTLQGSGGVTRNLFGRSNTMVLNGCPCGLSTDLDNSVLDSQDDTSTTTHFIAWPISGDAHTFVVAVDNGTTQYGDWNDLVLVLSDVTLHHV